MRTATYQVEYLKDYLKWMKIATLEQMRSELEYPVRSTVFRLLEQISYMTSYSHRGKYYTLKSTPRFSELGLWTLNEIHFSEHGNLLETCEQLVSNSRIGYSALELEHILHVKSRHALAQLESSGRLIRERLDGHYIYFSSGKNISTKQLRQHKIQNRQTNAVLLVRNGRLAVKEAKAVIILFFSLLNEKQRRLFAGLEALRYGYGGDVYIAEILGIDPNTAAKGRAELLEGKIDSERVRVKGAGRKKSEKKRRES